jgi:hypothetical protein
VKREVGGKKVLKYENELEENTKKESELFLSSKETWM